MTLVLLAACGDTAPPSADLTFSPGLIAVAPHLEGALFRAQHAAAAIRMPYDFDPDGVPLKAADGTTLVASCGATFIDPHHAITAGHCVVGQVGDPANRPVEADFFDVADTVPWQKTTTLTGTFPAYEHPRLTATDGYVVRTTTCHVVASCLGFPIDPESSTHCPVDAMPAGGADVALLRCDGDLPTGHGAIAIAMQPIAQGDPVTYFWFHELYFASQDASAESLVDFAAHYEELSDPADNFHYHGWDSNQLLPLAPIPYITNGNTIPQSVVAVEDGAVVTDLFGCHGSSGSGLLRREPMTGEYELIGPALAYAGPTTESDRLCRSRVSAGQPSLAFSSPEQVRAIAALR